MKLRTILGLALVNVVLATAVFSTSADAQSALKGCCRKEAGTSNKFCCTDCDCDAKTCSASADCKPAEE